MSESSRPAADATAETPGRAGERTALAWQRTALAVFAGTLLAARLRADRLGPAGLALLGAAAVLAGLVLVDARLRYRRSHGGAWPATGPSALALALAVVAVGVVEMLA